MNADVVLQSQRVEIGMAERITLICSWQRSPHTLMVLGSAHPEPPPPPPPPFFVHSLSAPCAPSNRLWQLAIQTPAFPVSSPWLAFALSLVSAPT